MRFVFVLLVVTMLASCTKQNDAENDSVLNGFKRLRHKKELCNQKIVLLDSSTSEEHQINLCVKLVEKLSENKSLSNSVIEVELNCRNLKNAEKVISDFSNVRNIELDSIMGAKLDIDFSKLSKLIRLKISNSEIPSIFASYYLNENLKTLLISNCKVDSILGGITGFVSLETLDIKETHGAQFCFSFEKFKHLESLSINNCGLTSIPESIFQCTNLKVIDFNDNKLTSLPDDLVNLINLNGYFFMGNCFVDTPMVLKTMDKWVEYGRVEIIDEE